MKRIITLITAVVLINSSHAQIQDITEKNQRFGFYPVQNNNAEVIAAAHITMEKIFWQPAEERTGANDILQTVNRYDINGRIISAVTGSGKNTKTVIYQYAFSESGKMTGKKMIAAAGGKNSVTEITYDENGREASCAIYNADSINIVRMQKEYNDDGICTGILYFDTDDRLKTLRKYIRTGDSMQTIQQFLGPSSYYTISFKNMGGTEEVYKNNEWTAAFSYDNKGRCREETRLSIIPASGAAFDDMTLTVSSDNYSSVFYQGNTLSVPAVEQSNVFRNSLSSGNVFGDNAESIIPSGSKTNYSINQASSITRSASVKKQTLLHGYNTDGTLAETKIITAGKISGTLYHVYETR